MMKLPRKERERIHFMSPGKSRGLERSRFFPGIATAMAEQWGDHIIRGELGLVPILRTVRNGNRTGVWL